MQKIQDVKDGKVEPDGITEDTIESYLDTAGVPDPDLLISHKRWLVTFQFPALADLPIPEFLKCTGCMAGFQ